MKNSFYQAPLTEVIEIVAQQTLLSSPPTPPPFGIEINQGAPLNNIESL